MQATEIETYEQRLTPLGGVIEWHTSFGLGVRFEAGTLTDEKLDSLQDVLPYIVWLDLSETRVTDVGLVSLSHATALEDVWLNKHISAAGVRQLAQLTKLAEINVCQTSIAKNEIEAIRSSYPDIRIASDP
jgi:hypothetical protein